MLEKLLRPGSQGTCAMCDQVCDTAADAIKALRQQVAELEGEAMTRSQDDGKLEREIERLQGQVAELEKDAARYRWLRDYKRGLLGGLFFNCREDEIDAAIDEDIASDAKEDK